VKWGAGGWCGGVCGCDEDNFLECQGLGGYEKRREVGQLVREKNPFILCIQETKLSVFDGMVYKYVKVIQMLIFLINIRRVLQEV